MKEEDLHLVAKNLSIPSEYAEKRLGIKLHPVQRDVLNAIFRHKGAQTSFLAANNVGKTSCVIVSAIAYAIEILNCMVISTSGQYRQITLQLIPQLKLHADKFKGWEFQANGIKVNGEERYKGFTPDKPEAFFQGFHEYEGKPLLVIVDEAASTSNGIWEGIGRNRPTFLLVTGSPLGAEGWFYNIKVDPNISKEFKQFKLTQPECLKKDGGWLKEEDINRFISMYGGIDNPLVRSSIYAEFYNNIENGVITLSELEGCYKYPSEKNVTDGIHVFIDFAAGGDETVMAIRLGNYIRIAYADREKDTMLAARRIASELEDLKQQHPELGPLNISGDADGMGLPIIHRLRELGWRINEFHGGAAPDNEHYKNKVCEVWFEGIKKIRNHQVILPDDQIFKSQLLSRKQYMHHSGKLMLETKEEMKSRGLQSPDRADAIFGAMATPKTGVLTFVEPVYQPKTTYNMWL